MVPWRPVIEVSEQRCIRVGLPKTPWHWCGECCSCWPEATSIVKAIGYGSVCNNATPTAFTTVRLRSSRLHGDSSSLATTGTCCVGRQRQAANNIWRAHPQTKEQCSAECQHCNLRRIDNEKALRAALLHVSSPIMPAKAQAYLHGHKNFSRVGTQVCFAR